jgi:ATP-dependent DNA helicase RecG
MPMPKHSPEIPIQGSLFDFLEGVEQAQPLATSLPRRERVEPARPSQDAPIAPARLALIGPEEIFERASQELLRNLREDRRIERKPANFSPRSVGDYICMWANTPPDGGLLVIGMEDDGAFTGCLTLGEGRINKLETAGATYCPMARLETKRVPVLRSQDEGDDFVLLFRVYYREAGVTETNSHEAFIRIGDEKKVITEDYKRELQNDRGQVRFESEPSRLTFPDDFDLDLIRSFCANVEQYDRLSGPHPPEEILELKHLGRRRDGTFTPNVACELLFARDPNEHFPGSMIRFFRFEGEEERTGARWNATKDIPISGPIPRMLEEAEAVIKSQLREFSRLGRDNKFYTAKEYPDMAWYEAVVNAVCHRSYGLSNMTVFVKMFDDRLEIESPGGFPPLVTPENIYLISNPINRHLPQALYYFDRVKLANEGTRRMRDSMKEAELPLPEFRQTKVEYAHSVKVTLRNDIQHRRVWIDSEISSLIGTAIFQELSNDERRALNFVAENGKINVSQVTRLTNRGWRSAKKMLLRLTRRDPEAHFVLRVKAKGGR